METGTLLSFLLIFQKILILDFKASNTEASD